MGLVNYFGHDCSLRYYKNLNMPFRMQLCGFNLAWNKTNILQAGCAFTEFTFLFEDGKWYYPKNVTSPAGNNATNANTGDFTFSVNGVPMIGRVVNAQAYYTIARSLWSNFWGQANNVSRGYYFLTKNVPPAITYNQAIENDFKSHSWYIEIIQADTANYAGIKGFSFFNSGANSSSGSPALRFYSTIGSFEYRVDKYYPDEWNKDTKETNITNIRNLNRRYFTMTLNDKVPLIEEEKGITAEQKD